MPLTPKPRRKIDRAHRCWDRYPTGQPEKPSSMQWQHSSMILAFAQLPDGKLALTLNKPSVWTKSANSF